MNITVAREDLLHLLETTIGSTDPTNALPVCASFMLSTPTAGMLRVAATSIQQSTVGTIAAEVHHTGPGVAVHAKSLLERVRALPRGPVRLTSHDNAERVPRVIVSSEVSKLRFAMPAIEEAQFPPIMTPEEDAAWTEVDASTLRTLIDRTAYAQSTDPSRPHVMATHIEWAGTRIRFATTDGHRMAVADLTTTAAPAVPLKLLLSRSEVAQVREIALAMEKAKSGPKTLRLSATDRDVFLDAGGLTFSAKLVESQFPPYEQIVSPAAKAPHVAKLNREAALEALQAMGLGSNGVALTFARGKLTIVMVSVDGTDATDEVALDYAGPALTIGVSAKYMEAAVKSMPPGELSMRLASELEPIAVSPATETGGERLLAIVMPMRLEAKAVGKAA